MLKFELFERSKFIYELRKRISDRSYEVYAIIKSKKAVDELAVEIINDLEATLNFDIYLIIK